LTPCSRRASSFRRLTTICSWSSGIAGAWKFSLST